MKNTESSTAPTTQAAPSATSTTTTSATVVAPQVAPISPFDDDSLCLNIFRIIMRSDIETLVKCREVSRRWKQLIDDDYLIKEQLPLRIIQQIHNDLKECQGCYQGCLMNRN